MAQPLYGALVAKLTRARFIPIVYHFFAFNLLVFWGLLTLGIAPVIVARVFFVWVKRLQPVRVAVFWSFMADLFTSEQGKRLFGFIGAGGTAGSLLGPVITIALAVRLGPQHLLLAAFVFLELAVFCAHRLERGAGAVQREQGAQGAQHLREDRQSVGGGAFGAFWSVLRSPYLLGVAAWVSLLSFGATTLYFAQANVVAAAVHGAGAQTRDLRQRRPGGRAAVAGHAGVRHRPPAQALRHRCGGGRAAGGVRDRLRGAGAGAEPDGGAGVPGRAALMNFAIANPARHLFFTVVEREENTRPRT